MGLEAGGFPFKELKANENAAGRNMKRATRCTYCAGVTATREQAQEWERLSAQESKQTKRRTGLGQQDREEKNISS